MSGPLSEWHEEVLRLKGPELLNKLSMGVEMRAYLRRYHVLSGLDVEDLQTLMPSEKKWYLLKNLKSEAQYRGFILTLLATKQEFIVTDILQENPDKYRATEGVDEMPDRECEVGIQTDSPGQHALDNVQEMGVLASTRPEEKVASFPSLRKMYLEKLSTSAAYEYSSRTQYYAFKDTFTSLTLHSLLINEVEPPAAAASAAAAEPIEEEPRFLGMLKKKKQTPITIRDMFTHKEGEKMSLLVEGAPGVGKTTLIKHILLSWSEGGMMNDDSESWKSSTINEKEFVMFVNHRHEKGTWKDTMMNSLRNVSNEEVKRGWELLDTDPDSCLLFVEGLDEFKNKDVINEMLDLVQSRKVHIVVSCRTHHPYTKEKRENFNRVVEVIGFEKGDVKTFMLKYMETINVGNSDFGKEQGKKLVPLLDIEEKHKFCTNPMNAVLVCLAYNEGDLDIDDVSSMTSQYIYTKFFQHVLERECRRLAAITTGGLINRYHLLETKELLQKSVEDMKVLEHVALHSLLSEGKQGVYSEDQLKDFGLDIQSPVMVLLTRETSEEEHGEVGFYSWPHQTFREFQAAQAVQNNKATLLAVAARPELNHVVKFLVQILVENDINLAIELLNAVLLLQSNDLPCLKKNVKNRLTSPFKRNHKCTLIKSVKKNLQEDVDTLLCNPVSMESTHTDLPLVSDIKHCITPEWFINEYQYGDVIDHLLSHINACESEQKSLALFEAVLQPLLPAISLNSEILKKALLEDESSRLKVLGMKLALTGSRLRYEIHQVPGKPQLLRLAYWRLTPMARAVLRARGEFDGGLTGTMSIYLDNLWDITAGYDIIRNFTTTTREGVRLDVDPETLQVRDESRERERDLLKEILFRLCEIVKPWRLVIDTDLEPAWLTPADHRYMKERGVEQVWLQDEKDEGKVVIQG